jgi:hypothetical protein
LVTGLNKKIRSGSAASSQLEKEFDFILHRVIDETLRNIGRTFDSVVYYVLNQKYSVKEEDISEGTMELSKCLQMMFGKKGRVYIEKLITTRLYIKIRESHNPIQEKNFVERVEYAKQAYIKKKKI